jgi:MFS family permease
VTTIIRSGRQWLQRVGRALHQNTFAVPGTTKRIQRALWLFWLDGLLVSTSVSLVGSYVVLYALKFGATSAEIGLMSTVIGVASMMALLPGAQLSEKWLDPKRAVLIFSRGIGQLVWLALGALPFFLTGQPAVYGVLALRATRSFTMQASNPAWTTLSGQIVPQRLRGKYFAARNIAKQVAALLIVPAAGWLIDRLGFPVGYQLCFGLATIVGIGAFWAYARIPFEPAQRDPETAEAVQDARIWNNTEDRRNFWTFCATSACWTFSVQVAAPFFSVYLVEVLGAGAGIVGTLAAAQNLTALPGQVLYGRWLDRRGIKRTFAFSGLLIPLMIWSWMLVRGPWGVLPIRIAAGFLFAGYNLSNFNMLLAVTPQVRRTRYIALYRTITQSAVALAPLLGGLIVDKFGFLPVFALSGIGRLTSVLLLMRFVREPQKQA